jgi:hypothetical protein
MSLVTVLPHVSVQKGMAYPTGPNKICLRLFYLKIKEDRLSKRGDIKGFNIFEA